MTDWIYFNLESKIINCTLIYLDFLQLITSPVSSSYYIYNKNMNLDNLNYYLHNNRSDAHVRVRGVQFRGVRRVCGYAGKKTRAQPTLPQQILSEPEPSNRKYNNKVKILLLNFN